MENGDTISIQNEYFNGNIEELVNIPQMTFKYVSFWNPLSLKTHKAISVISSDGNSVFLHESESIDILHSNSVLFYIIGILPILLSSVLLLPLEKILLYKRRKQHKRGKQSRKMN